MLFAVFIIALLGYFLLQVKESGKNEELLKQALMDAEAEKLRKKVRLNVEQKPDNVVRTELSQWVRKRK